MSRSTALNRKPVSGELFGWIKEGTFVPYPKIYSQKKEEAKSLTFAVISASTKVCDSVDLNEYFMETLVKYQNKLLLYKVQSGVEPDFFDKIGAFAMALATTQRPIIEHIPSKLQTGNRCNILIAVEFALLTCKDPDLIKDPERQVPPIDFEQLLEQEHLKVIKRNLAKTLSHNPKDLMPFTCKLMDFYMLVYRIAEAKKKNFVKALN